MKYAFFQFNTKQLRFYPEDYAKGCMLESEWQNFQISSYFETDFGIWMTIYTIFDEGNDITAKFNKTTHNSLASQYSAFDDQAELNR